MAASIPLLTDADAPVQTQQTFQAIQGKLGKVLNFFRALGHSHPVLKATIELDGAIKNDLEPKLRELAYLKVSQLNGCDYCSHYHRGPGTKAGLTGDQLESLANYQSSSAFTDLEKAVMRFAEEWTKQGKASPAVVQQLAQQLTPAQLVTLAATVGLANWTNRFNTTFDIPLP